jgi:hypothetical protein
MRSPCLLCSVIESGAKTFEDGVRPTDIEMGFMGGIAACLTRMVRNQATPMCGRHLEMMRDTTQAVVAQWLDPDSNEEETDA